MIENLNSASSKFLLNTHEGTQKHERANFSKNDNSLLKYINNLNK